MKRLFLRIRIRLILLAIGKHKVIAGLEIADMHVFGIDNLLILNCLMHPEGQFSILGDRRGLREPKNDSAE